MVSRPLTLQCTNVPAVIMTAWCSFSGSGWLLQTPYSSIIYRGEGYLLLVQQVSSVHVTILSRVSISLIVLAGVLFLSIIVRGKYEFFRMTVWAGINFSAHTASLLLTILNQGNRLGLLIERLRVTVPDNLQDPLVFCDGPPNFEEKAQPPGYRIIAKLNCSFLAVSDDMRKVLKGALSHPPDSGLARHNGMEAPNP